jgi:hypothetical protein
MPTHDYIIANGTGAAVRADINLALSAIVSLNSSASEPGTMYAYQLWADTGSNPSLLKIRNGANSAWITLRQLDGDFSIVAVEDGLQATPSLTFTNDLNTGVFRSGTDALAIVTGGQYAIACTSTQAVGIKTANPSTALHVAGNARVGADDVTDAHLQIGKGATGNRNSYIDIVADTTYTDYGLRVIRNNTGANATSELKHRGTGALNFTTEEAAPIVFNTTNSPRATIDSDGRLLVGTSTARSNVYIGGSSATPLIQSETSGSTYNNGASLLTYSTVNYAPILTLGTSNSDTAGTNAAVGSDYVLGFINFVGNDGTDFISGAFVSAAVDGSVSTGDLPTRLVFSTTADEAASPTERMRITSYGTFLASNAGSYPTTTGTYHAFSANSPDDLILRLNNTSSTNPYGVNVVFDAAAPNDTTRFFLNCADNAALRATIRSNGGLANYSANNANLSDRNVKKDISPAANTWNCIKEWEIVNYRYKDQPDDADLNLGVIAQQVAESCPEVITIFQEAKEATEDKPAQEERLGVKEQQMYWMAIKALQEAMGRIEQLETKVAALESA